MAAWREGGLDRVRALASMQMKLEVSLLHLPPTSIPRTTRRDVQFRVGFHGVVGSCCMLGMPSWGVFVHSGVSDQQLFEGVDVGGGPRGNRCGRFAAVMSTRLFMHVKGTVKSLICSPVLFGIRSRCVDCL